ncbi:hypothetical protein [Paenibacillus polymyxa]|uniref:hypothetical protein n=1 Tax=Paenibacillus polymyxa TaxID=1406 RepID=UPI0021E3D580|nr:hypothetical protein [Paenibacillus polymyxa]
MDELKNVVNELAAIYKAGGVRTTRFSITLTEKDNNRIEDIADTLQMSKQEIITKLLMAAVTDLEYKLAQEKAMEVEFDEDLIFEFDESND